MEGPTPQETLCAGGTEGPHDFQLIEGFHSFGNRLQAETLGEGDDGTDDRGVAGRICEGNRRSFSAELARHVTTVARYGPTGAVLMLDVVHFKQVNDSWGHHAVFDVCRSIS